VRYDAHRAGAVGPADRHQPERTGVDAAVAGMTLLSTVLPVLAFSVLIVLLPRRDVERGPEERLSAEVRPRRGDHAGNWRRLVLILLVHGMRFLSARIRYFSTDCLSDLRRTMTTTQMTTTSQPPSECAELRSYYGE